MEKHLTLVNGVVDQVNCLDFEGLVFKFKVVARSDVKNFGIPYLLSILKDFDQLLHKYYVEIN